MTERTWERYGAATGIGFGILLLVSLFAAPAPPHIDASTTKIAAYFGDHRHAVVIASLVGVFAAVAALLFIAHLRHVFDRVENGIEGLSTVIYATGLATVAAGALGGIATTTLAFMTVQPGSLDTLGTTRALYDLTAVSNGVTAVFAAAFLGATAIGMVRGEVATQWLGWCAAADAALLLVAGIGLLTVSSYSGAWTGIVLVAIVGFAAWVITAGAEMIRHPEAEAVGQHRSLVAPAQ
jgi:hypothetical protein